jgi:hypothetical protein
MVVGMLRYIEREVWSFSPYVLSLSLSAFLAFFFYVSVCMCVQTPRTILTEMYLSPAITVHLFDHHLRVYGFWHVGVYVCVCVDRTMMKASVRHKCPSLALPLLLNLHSDGHQLGMGHVMPKRV